MLLRGVSSHQAPATELFSEAKTLSARDLARVGRTRRLCFVRVEFRYRGGLKPGFSNISSDIGTSLISVGAGVEVSKKKASVPKQTQGTSKDVEFETRTLSRKTCDDMIFVDRSSKQFGKDFSVLAELLNSASLRGGKKPPSSKRDPGREPNQSVSSFRTMEDVLNSWSSKVENKVSADLDCNEMLSKRFFSQKYASQFQKVGENKLLVERGNSRKVPEKQSIDSPVGKGRSKENMLEKTLGSGKGNAKGKKENMISQASPSMSIQSSAETILESRQSPAEASSKVGDAAVVDKVEKPSLRGRDILLAMQKAAIERAKHKQRNRTASERAVKVNENSVSQETLDKRNARPIVIRPEWALQIESLEGRIKDLKHQMQTL